MIFEWRTDNPPEEKCEYLVTDNCGCLQIATWTNETYLGHKIICDWHWKCEQYTKVVAWLPLPRPYELAKENEHEED